MATFVYGGIVKSYWRTYIYYWVSADTDTSITYRCWWGIKWVKAIEGNDDATDYWTSNDTTYMTCTGKAQKNASPSAVLTRNWYNGDADKCYGYTYADYTFTKGKSASTATVKAYISHNSKRALYKGTSTATATLSIPARKSYTISFNGNPRVSGDTVINMPSSITKYYGYDITLPAGAPIEYGYSFTSWNTSADGTGTAYGLNSNYSGNANQTLYAIWGAVDPPTCDIGSITLSTSASNVIRSFTDITCHISDIEVYHDRTLVGIKMRINGHESNTITAEDDLTISAMNDGVPTFTTADEGSHTVYIITEDSEGGIGEYNAGTVTIVAPTWSNEIVINTNKFPSVDPNGNAILEALEIYNYTTSSYDSVQISNIKLIDNTTTWAFDYVFDEDHVDDKYDDNPAVAVRTTYKSYQSNVSLDRQAFYSTSRNQNYSNGIYNVMFVGGVDNTQYPKYTSRSWWSKINDPLYFPDTNYVEVGSNDTSIQGLTKVGDYLAVIKQSKTTDTAIFLLYPTSFEEETTYAVKQGVQGVGALSRYSFNILGDETLFLSPKGVMSIVPTQDEEHKVQNRSYFIDKRLLAETDLKNSYSFVFDGKYFLSVGNGNCYVLDGNQRNSWGNDKTNLVYECYFLDNVPATCFVKYHDRLVFSNVQDICMFGDSFTDAYGENNEPKAVYAKWSTIFDDDNALHYYKTMQKKGNLVSILPLENQTPYKNIAIDEDTFNANKTNYYVFEDGKFVQCTESTEYSADEQYYIENRTATKVMVRKDDAEPVEIQRKFNLLSAIPSELFINKKFKKYKRLQFILTNDADEDFGVDEIVKNYTVGNYAKK